MIDLPVEPLETAAQPRNPAPGRRRFWPGTLSLLAAVVMVAVAMVGLNLSIADPATATILGFAAIALSLLAVVFGIIAIASAQGRGLGIAGVIIGVLLNPAVGVRLLDLIAGVFRS